MVEQGKKMKSYYFWEKKWIGTYSRGRGKVGLGISRTNADSQWISVYNVFHRICCCENEAILSVM